MFSFFFFNDTATTEIYTLSLHDALPIFHHQWRPHLAADGPLALHAGQRAHLADLADHGRPAVPGGGRSEEHTSELQSLAYLVCRLLLEKKKKRTSHTASRCTPAYSDTEP